MDYIPPTLGVYTILGVYTVLGFSNTGVSYNSRQDHLVTENGPCGIFELLITHPLTYVPTYLP